MKGLLSVRLFTTVYALERYLRLYLPSIPSTTGCSFPFWPRIKSPQSANKFAALSDSASPTLRQEPFRSWMWFVGSTTRKQTAIAAPQPSPQPTSQQTSQQQLCSPSQL
ncbi:hypothetical protein VTK56DRAFT_2278 [Thermocarpiscus australiensis]